MLTYARSQHRFFDDLLTFLISVSSLGLAFDAHRSGSATPYLPTDCITLEGTAKVSNIELCFFPYPVMQVLIANQWPQQINIQEKSLRQSSSAHPLWLTGIQGVHGSMIESAFVHYFESVRSVVEAKYSTNPQRWPSVLNFARVIRNAFAHGGVITFRSTTAPAVSWRSLTYSPSHNGLQILYQDVTAVELILLMEDMDAAL